jgi:hypothetical protein
VALFPRSSSLTLKIQPCHSFQKEPVGSLECVPQVNQCKQLKTPRLSRQGDSRASAPHLPLQASGSALTEATLTEQQGPGALLVIVPLPSVCTPFKHVSSQMNFARHTLRESNHPNRAEISGSYSMADNRPLILKAHCRLPGKLFLLGINPLITTPKAEQQAAAQLSSGIRVSNRDILALAELAMQPVSHHRRRSGAQSRAAPVRSAAVELCEEQCTRTDRNKGLRVWMHSG